MPIVVPRKEEDEKFGPKMSPEAELMVVCGWGKCPKRLDRVLKKKPNVNFKNDDGYTPLHQAAMAGSAEFCKKLIEAGADPNVPATEALLTPLEWVQMKIDYERARDQRLNGFDTVNRLDDTTMAVRPNIKPFEEVKEVLVKAGGIHAKAYDPEPNIKPDGSIGGGEPSALRSYNVAPDGSYTKAYHLRSGKYDVLKYEDGKLVEAEYDPTTGHWEGYDPALAGPNLQAIKA